MITIKYEIIKISFLLKTIIIITNVQFRDDDCYATIHLNIY